MSRLLTLLSVVFCLGLAINCANQNPSPTGPGDATEKKDDQKTDPNTANKSTIDTLIIDGDSSDLGDLYFEFDFSEMLEELGDTSKTLKKALANNRSGQLIYKIKHLSRFDFTATNAANASVSSSYPIDSTGKCSVNIIKIARGSVYYIYAGFSGVTMCPWSLNDSSYSLSNEYFFARDTVDLKTKSKDTLRLVLRENHNTKYFVSIEKPVGKYTDGKKYSVVESWNKGAEVKALYSGGKLKHRIYCQNSDTLAQFTLSDDTGKVTFPFSFDINTVIDDDVIECLAKGGSSNNDDTIGGVFVSDIQFEYQIPLKTTKIEPKDGGIAMYFNRIGRMYVGSSTLFRVELGRDTTNLVKKADIKELDGCIHWKPASALKAGSYSLKAQKFLDEYGNESPLVQDTLVLSGL